MPFREVKRKLEAAGFKEAGQTGSHVRFAKTTARRYSHRHCAQAQ
ncbi:MAG: type II toxin-antitoxin system HicA family toxin [Acidobacteriota bacterium]